VNSKSDRITAHTISLSHKSSHQRIPSQNIIIAESNNESTKELKQARLSRQLKEFQKVKKNNRYTNHSSTSDKHGLKGVNQSETTDD
jgi:arginine repressor